VSVLDSLGLTGDSFVEVVVDNVEPWAEQTTPALLRAGIGGNVYTTDGAAHLYFPPRAFSQDVVVRISTLDSTQVPDALASGAQRVSAGYSISWGDVALEKTATLDLACGDPESSTLGRTLALYASDSYADWQRIGGSPNPSSETISAPIRQAGGYAVFAETAGVTGPATLSTLSMTPRVFSPLGGSTSDGVAIGFTLGQPGAVWVRVYNRAGRLVREVLAGGQMNAGSNLVRWDGRNDGGRIVSEGLYLVSVEALGAKQVLTVAVAR
jgi:hypothetical protein